VLSARKEHKVTYRGTATDRLHFIFCRYTKHGLIHMH